jgi:hypothetical protein
MSRRRLAIDVGFIREPGSTSSTATGDRRGGPDSQGEKKTRLVVVAEKQEPRTNSLGDWWDEQGDF